MRPGHGTIAVLTKDLEDYSQVVVGAVGKVAAEAGYGTLCVVGSELAPDSGDYLTESVANGVYRLLEHSDIDGVVCASGMLGHLTGPEPCALLLQRYDMPCVSVGLELEGVPSVIGMDSGGMRDVMEHLIMQIDGRCFAFVRGLIGDTFSLEREGVFRDALTEHGYPINEELFVWGNFDAFDAYAAVEAMLKEHPGIDAIVCANDTMALSAARAVTAAGLAIPQDIVVTGFDDLPDATRISPALTTVRQPLVEMASVGTRTLIESIARCESDAPLPLRAPNPVVRLHGELVVRGSSASHVNTVDQSKRNSAVDVKAILNTGMAGLVTPDGIDRESLFDKIARAIAQQSTALAAALETAIADTVSEITAHWWSNLCHQIELLSLTRHEDEDQDQDEDEDSKPDQRVWGSTVTAALAPIREQIRACEMDREFTARRHEGLRSRALLQIGSAINTEETLLAVDGWIASFSPQRFFLVRYDNVTSEARSRGVLLRAVCNGAIQKIQQAQLETRHFLPVEYQQELREGTLMLLPVCAGIHHFGYLLVDPEGVDVAPMDTVAQSIGNAMRTQMLIEVLESQASRLQSANAELSTRANQDVLTGLPNRFYFENYLDDLCRSAEKQTAFAVCFLDLDGFKLINDSLGHEQGDELLRTVATELRSVVARELGERGAVARLGGDEFTVVVLSEEPEKELQRFLPILLKALSVASAPKNDQVFVSASIGAALYPDHAQDPATLLNCADLAMYEAKAQGKNRYSVYREGSVRSSVDVSEIGDNRSPLLSVADEPRKRA